MNKTAESAAPLAKCILLHTSGRTTVALRLKILKKLRTASLNSEFTSSYKKVYIRTQGSVLLKI